MLSGLMGHFDPALPIAPDELDREGIWDLNRLCDPYIPLWLVRIVFGQAAQAVMASYLDEALPGHYKLKNEFNTQRKIEDNINAPADASPEVKQKTAAIKAGL
jgi:4-alpha-glucanotransferase